MNTPNNINNTPSLPDEFSGIFSDMDPQGAQLLFAFVDAARNDAAQGNSTWPTLVDVAHSIAHRVDDAMREGEITVFGAFALENWNYMLSLMVDECCRVQPENWDVVKQRLERRYIGYALSLSISDEFPHSADDALWAAAGAFRTWLTSNTEV